MNNVEPAELESGSLWNDGTYTGVRRVIIVSGVVIDSIQFEYVDLDGDPVLSPRHGGGGGTQFHKVELEYPGEYLVSLSGYYTVSSSNINVIKSMKFMSNKRTYGPFGWEQGSQFSVPPTSGKINGFHGKCGRFLNAIEPYFDQPAFLSSIGPYGGRSGYFWNDGEEEQDGIKQIELSCDSIVHSIRTEYDCEGRPVWSYTHGKSKGGNKTMITLDYPNEYLTCVTGYYSATTTPVVIQSLTFQTNLNSYGPFGDEKGKYFSLSSFKGKIIGFHGRSDNVIHSIGAYTRPIVECVGPFGGTSGAPWDDKIHTGIKQIKIAYGSKVYAVFFEYDDEGVSKWSPMHGDDDQALEFELITIDHPDDYLISVHGYSLDDENATLSSITFETNKRLYGPFGDEIGTPFSFPSSKGKIVGFHGRSSNILDSIGGHVEPDVVSPHQHSFTRPLGGGEGEFWDDGIYTTIRKIEITVNPGIESIRVEYDSHGRSIWCQRHGGNAAGSDMCTVELDYPNEFIVSVSGKYGFMSGRTVVLSLTLQTNKGTHGPFGLPDEGESFSVAVNNGGKIVGFNGRSCELLDALGVYTEPGPMPTPYNIFGPYGGKDGSLWDDGTHTTIRKIKVAAGDYIDSIRVEYDDGGYSALCTKHGESEGGEKSTILLDYPGEFIISMSGYHDKEDNSSTVRQLTFESNKRTYGPFGTKSGEFFAVPQSDGKIIGFHGRSSLFIDSIGAYVVPIISRHPSEFIKAFGGQGGNPWDDGVHDTVRTILIGKATFGIEYMRFEYDKHGRSVWSNEHGVYRKGKKYLQIDLDYPGEFLVSISGYFDCFENFVTPNLQSILLQSNKRTYGPYGYERGTSFELPSTPGKIVGFHGRSSNGIDSIGVYLKPVTSASDNHGLKVKTGWGSC